MDVIILHKRTWYILDLHWFNRDELFLRTRTMFSP